MLEVLGLLAARYWRWGWVFGIAFLLQMVAWLALGMSTSGPDLSGSPDDIAAAWNEASRGIPVTADSRTLRTAFVQHLRELGAALGRGDEDAAEDARDRLAEDFDTLRTLRVRHGLAH